MLRLAPFTPCPLRVSRAEIRLTRRDRRVFSTQPVERDTKDLANTESLIEETNVDTKITIDGYEIRVLEGPYTDGDAATPAATTFARQLIGMLPAMKQFAAQELLDTYNDSWAEDEDDELDAAQFAANLVSPKIVIYDELGAATVYFADSDMFAGHSIEVWINEGEISDASLVG